MPESRIPATLFAMFEDRYRPLRELSPAAEQGFSGAEVFQVETTVGLCCLRRWPADAPPIARIRGLHRLIAHVRDHGVSWVAVPIATIDGQTLVDLGGQFWQLEPWMPGRADFHENPSDIRLRNVMRALAAWHKAALTFQPTRDEAQWFTTAPQAASPALAERLAILREWNTGRLLELERVLANAPRDEFQRLGKRGLCVFRQLAQSVEDMLRWDAQLQFSIQPCLRDIHHDHVLFEEDVVTGLIDPSACRSESVAVDLSRLIGSLVGDDRRSWDLALDEYSRYHPLQPEERALVQVFDTSGLLLSAMRWLDRRYLQHESFPQPQRVLARVQGILDRLESRRG